MIGEEFIRIGDLPFVESFVVLVEGEDQVVVGLLVFEEGVGGQGNVDWKRTLSLFQDLLAVVGLFGLELGDTGGRLHLVGLAILLC